MLGRLGGSPSTLVALVRDPGSRPPRALRALKLLDRELLGDLGKDTVFAAAVRRAGRLRHPNIVGLRGFGSTALVHHLVMEYVFGASLAQVLRASAWARTPLTVGAVLHVVASVCRALEYAQEVQDERGEPLSLVHGYITPHNILVGFDGGVKVADFGIAHLSNRASCRVPGNEPLIDMLKRAGKPVVLLVNKIDTLRDRKSLLFQLQAFQDALGDVLATAVPISAMKKDGLDRVVKSLAAHLPEGPAYFEDGQVTDKTERQIVSELIREKVILETRDELPYAAHVDVERFEDERPKIVRIAATVVVERSSQKPIVIGRGGERIKAIGVRARQELEHFLDAHVFLELHVRVQENWTNSPTLLADLGYSSEGDVAAAGDEDEDGLLDGDLDDDDADDAADGDDADDAADGDDAAGDDAEDGDDGDEGEGDEDEGDDDEALDDDDTLPTPSERAR